MAGTDLLAAWLDVALDHQAFDQSVEIGIDRAAEQDFFGDPDLLFIMFVRVGMVGVDDGGWIFQVLFPVFLQEQP